MWKRWRSSVYYRPSLGAIALHVSLLLLLSVNWLWSPAPTVIELSADKTPEIIQATAVSEAEYQQEIQRVDKLPVAKKNAEAKKIEKAKAVEAQAAAEKREKQKIAEQKHIEAARLAEQQAEKQAEAKKIEEAKKVEEVKAVAAAEEKKKQEEAKEAAKQAEAAAEKAKAAEAAEQEKIKAEQTENARLLAEKQAQAASEISRYEALIKQKIFSVWSVPPGAAAKQKVRLLVRLAPDGTVMSAQIVESSGNSALDQSAYAAVLRASPLPVPSDLSVFNMMRELDLVLTPQV